MSKNTNGINPNIVDLSPSVTLRVKEKCNQLRKKGRDIHDLGLGQSPFPIPTPVVEELKKYASEKSYLPVQGLVELREAVASFHSRKENLKFDKDDIIIGPGSKELFFLLQLVINGEIILPTPCWVSYAPQAKITGNNIKLVKTNFEDNWRLRPEELKKLGKKENTTRILFFNYPGNPTGTTYSEKELKELAETAKDLGILILSDEIYGEVNHEGNHVSIARFYPEGTIISSGLSKWCGAGGWRLGTFAFPKELDWIKKPMISVASETFSCVAAPVQYAAIKAYTESKDIDNYLQHVRRIFKTLGQECARILLDSNIKLSKPEGGFYLFIDFSNFREQLNKIGVYNSKQLCDKLLQDAGVAIISGSDFERPDEELNARLAYVNFDGEKALEISKNLGLDKSLPEDFTTKYCGDTIKAMRAISSWVKSI